VSTLQHSTVAIAIFPQADEPPFALDRAAAARVGFTMPKQPNGTPGKKPPPRHKIGNAPFIGS